MPSPFSALIGHRIEAVETSPDGRALLVTAVNLSPDAEPGSPGTILFSTLAAKTSRVCWTYDAAAMVGRMVIAAHSEQQAAPQGATCIVHQLHLQGCGPVAIRQEITRGPPAR